MHCRTGRVCLVGLSALTHSHALTRLPDPLTHSLTHSLTHPQAHSLTHSHSLVWAGTDFAALHLPPSFASLPHSLPLLLARFRPVCAWRLHSAELPAFEFSKVSLENVRERTSEFAPPEATALGTRSELPCEGNSSSVGSLLLGRWPTLKAG